MAQKRFTLSKGDKTRKDVVIATDGTSFTGDIRLIIKDSTTKSEIINLINLLVDTFLTESYPF